MKQPWTTRALLFILAMAAPAGAAAAPSVMLTKLGCLAPQVEAVTAEEERFELKTSLLESYLITGVKERIPRVPVKEACNNVLYLSVSMVRGEDDPGSHYSTRVRLEVRRLATLADNGKEGLVTVWDSEAFVIGEKFEVQRTTLETIGQLIGVLGEDLRASGGL